MVKLNIEQASAKIVTPDIGPAKAAIESYQDTAKKAMQDVEQTSQSVANSLVDANVKMLDSFKQAGEGAFTLARGIAFLGASSEENFQKSLKEIARFQGAFDVFKGGIDTIRGLVEAGKVLTTTNAAVAASNTAVGTSATTASVGVRALQLAMGPIGIALAATTAILGGLAYVFYQSKKAADDAKESYKKYYEEVQNISKVRVLLQDAERESSVSELRTATDRLNAIQQQSQRLERRRDDLTREQQRLSQEQGIAASVGDEDRRAKAMAYELAITRDIDAVNEALRNNARDRLQAEKEISQQSQDELKNQQATLQVLQQKIDAERQRLQSADAAIGQLDELERRKLETVSEKYARGEQLSRADLDAVRRYGGSGLSGFVQEQYADRGREAGSRDILRRFGVDAGEQESGLTQQRQSILDSLGVADIGQAEIEIARRIEEYAKKKQDATGRIITYLETLNNSDQQTQSRLERLEEEMRRRRGA